MDYYSLLVYAEQLRKTVISLSQSLRDSILFVKKLARQNDELHNENESNKQIIQTQNQTIAELVELNQKQDEYINYQRLVQNVMMQNYQKEIKELNDQLQIEYHFEYKPVDINPFIVNPEKAYQVFGQPKNNVGFNQDGDLVTDDEIPETGCDSECCKPLQDDLDRYNSGKLDIR